MGANILGKHRGFMPYVGGVGTYGKICTDKRLQRLHLENLRSVWLDHSDMVVDDLARAHKHSILRLL